MRIIYLPFIALMLSAYTAQAQSDSSSRLTDLSLDELMNIKVITASGYMQSMAEAPSTIQVISSKQIAERGYLQLEDALRDIPGIDMIHINGYAPTLIYFRGMYGSENLRALFMIDGIAENNIIGSNDMAGPAYSLHNVDRIEIIWGPASALYGSNAFGGIINIITKKGSQINGIYAEKGYGTFNTAISRASLGIQKSKFEIALSGSLYNSDGPKFTNRDPNYTGSYVANAYTLNASISYLARNNRTTLGYRDAKTPMGWGTYSNSPVKYLKLPLQGNLNNGTLGILARDIRGEKSGLEVSFKRAFYLQNEFSPSDKFKLFGRLIYRETGTGEDSYVYITIDGKRMIRSPIATYSNRASGELGASYIISDKQKLFAGAEYYEDNVERGSRRITFDMTTVFLSDGRDTVVNLQSTFLPRLFDVRKNYGGYLQYILNTALLGKTEFTLGARYDKNSYFGDALSPRIAVVNHPVKDLTFKLQYGTAFRAPTNIEIYQTPGGNFQIRKEKIRTYEANAIYSLSKGLHLELNGFRNVLTDAVVLSNLPGLSLDKNPGRLTINGLEAAADIAPAKTVHGFANFTYQHAIGKNLLTNVSGYLPGIAKFKGNTGATVQIDSTLTLSLSENWVGKRTVQRTNPYGPVAGYFLSNFSVSTAKLFGNRISASLDVRNIFNKKWLDPGFRTADGFLYSTVLEQPGRTAMIRVSLSLENK